MKEIALTIFGDGAGILWWQMGVRACLFFFFTLLFIRISGRRSFSMKSPFDNTVTILLGAVMARGIVGASSIGGALFASFSLVGLHRICAWLCIYSPAVNRIFKGSPIVLYEDGRINQSNLYKSLITEEELKEEMRMEANVSSLDKVEKVILEGNGKVSVITKE